MAYIINNETAEALPEVWLPVFEEIFAIFCAEEDIPASAEVGLTFMEDEAIKALNFEYRGIDRATDVLSFPLYEPDEAFEADEEILLGDIVISLPHARAQAVEYGHSLAREVTYLLTHGLLHLAGYDHMNDVERGVMRSHEERILARVGMER